MMVTSELAQTLTCNIGDVTKAVTVSWKDKEGSLITNEQAGYTIAPGTVFPSNIQEATLTISPQILRTLTSPVTYKCAARSVQYPDSAISADQNAVVAILTLSKCNFQQIWER